MPKSLFPPKLTSSLLAVTLGLSSFSVQSRDTFIITLATEGQTVSRGYASITDMEDTLSTAGLNSLVGAYTTNSAAATTLDFRGLSTLANFALNSTALRFQIPSLNVNEVFIGTDRDHSVDLLLEYLKSNGDGLLTQMLQEMAGNTPVDPAAGNPASLMGRMASDNFSQGAFGFSGDEAQGQTENAVGIGLRFGRYSAGAFDQNVYEIPISYTAYFADPRYQLKFDLPLQMMDVGGSQSYSGSFGVGFKFPVMKHWSLTPAARIGAVGSVDMASAAIIYSGSITSNYNIFWNDLKLSIGNMLGYFKTQSIDAGDYKIDYALSNPMTKNGLSAEGSTNFKLLGKPSSWQVAVANTKFWGDELYVDNYWDLGFSLGTRQVPNNSLWNHLRLGMTYTHGSNDYKGWTINFGYRF